MTSPVSVAISSRLLNRPIQSARTATSNTDAGTRHRAAARAARRGARALSRTAFAAPSSIRDRTSSSAFPCAPIRRATGWRSRPAILPRTTPTTSRSILRRRAGAGEHFARLASDDARDRLHLARRLRDRRAARRALARRQHLLVRRLELRIAEAEEETIVVRDVGLVGALAQQHRGRRRVE